MDNMIDQLMKFDFTESEAKVYLGLLQNGPATGYESAKQSGVARSKVYDTLNRLHRRGAIIVSTGEKTKLYSAIGIEELTGLLEKNVQQDLSELARLGKDYGQVRDNEAVWEMTDFNAIMQRAVLMVREAREELMIQIWAPELTEEFENELLKAESRNLRFLCILYDSDHLYKTRLKKVYQHGFEADKLLETKARWLTIVADKECMLHLSLTAYNQCQAFVTRNHTMTFFAEEYVIHDAYCLKLIQRLEKTVKDTFGTDMEELRDIFKLPN